MKTSNFFKNLPEEIILLIDSFLDARSLVRFSKTDQRNNKIAKKLLPAKLFEKTLLETEFEQILNKTQLSEEDNLKLNNLLKRGVNPNMKLSSGSPALIKVIIWHGLSTFLRLAYFMDSQDLITQKDNILKFLKERIKPEFTFRDKQGNLRTEPCSIPLDIETNIKTVIFYLEGKSALENPEESLQLDLLTEESYQTVIQVSTFMTLAKLFTPILPKFFHQTHPAHIILSTSKLRNLLTPISPMGVDFLEDDERKEFLATRQNFIEALQKASEIKIEGSGWLSILKKDLLQNINLLQEFLKNEMKTIEVADEDSSLFRPYES